MNRPLKGGLLLLGVVLVCALSWAFWRGYWTYQSARGIWQEDQHETEAPTLPAGMEDFALLLFTKTNGYRHIKAIPASLALFRSFAEAQGWSLVHEENAAVHNEAQLSRFRVVIWSNATGDVLLPPQRAALRAYVEGGGGFVGIHGSVGGDAYEWDWHWYADELVRARFRGHTRSPQIAVGELIREDGAHPATRHLPQRWRFEDELYSFHASPRGRGVRVLLRLDEDSYETPAHLKLKMAQGDHPLVWSHSVGQGRVFISALGHRGSSYKDAHYRRLLEEAVRWAGRAENP